MLDKLIVGNAARARLIVVVEQTLHVFVLQIEVGELVHFDYHAKLNPSVFLHSNL